MSNPEWDNYNPRKAQPNDHILARNWATYEVTRQSPTTGESRAAARVLLSALDAMTGTPSREASGSDVAGPASRDSRLDASAVAADPRNGGMRDTPSQASGPAVDHDRAMATVHLFLSPDLAPSTSYVNLARAYLDSQRQLAEAKKKIETLEAKIPTYERKGYPWE